MPELPEVDTIKSGLNRHILNKKIVKIKVTKPKLVRNNLAVFKKTLQQNSIINIDRIGKLLIFDLSDQKNHILAHLKMTGQLIYILDQEMIAGGHETKNLESLPNKYSHIIFDFQDGSRLFFNDLRQFGYMHLVGSAHKEKVVQKYGIEPGATNFTLENFQKIFARRQGILKAILLNQNIISGIGNIYADEICFEAGVLPNRRADSLANLEIKKLYAACQAVIKKAIKYGGTTFRDYRQSDGNTGNFIKYLKVYHRQGQKCLKCKKNIIKKIKVAGRSTHFCATCQK